MSKILEIGNCWECKHHSYYQNHYCSKSTKQWGGDESFPGHCPLQDKPKPITGEWVWSEYSKPLGNDAEKYNKEEFWMFDKLAEAINAHFGAK